MSQLTMAEVQQQRQQPIWCYDNEDIEDWLAEEGIGYFDESGMFHYATSPKQNDIDWPVREEVEK